jgi:predicted RNA methylase
LMHPHHELAQAMTLAQIAISLASITALTRRRWLFGVAAIAAAGSGMLWVTALMS